MRYCEINKNSYYDSVTLMLMSSELNKIKNVKEAAVMMGTAHNIQLMTDAGLLSEDIINQASPNDLLIGICSDDENTIEEARNLLKALFENKQKAGNDSLGSRYSTIDGAINEFPNCNLAVVSVPGRYAARETMKLLEADKNVLLFSDNVSLEDELELKKYAVEHELLMMGPDCGTAVINGKAIGFANVVNRGTIGIAAASGTGLQELTCLIHRMGHGISQGLGTGGRDLKGYIGGLMILQELKALNEDENTKVIGIISKPGDTEVMNKIMAYCNAINKPVVALIMGKTEGVNYGNVICTQTIEELARTLVQKADPLNEVITLDGKEYSDAEIIEAAKSLECKPCYIRGLFSGGTLGYEALLLMNEKVDNLYSNIATEKKYLLDDPEKSIENTILDMGEDYFTNGMPHPMIDMRLRHARMILDAADPRVGIFLLDCVLGFGCHENPAEEIVNMVKETREKYPDRKFIFIASVCGTDDDVQCRMRQVEILESAGIYVTPSNAQAVYFAMKVYEYCKKEGGSNEDK